MLMKYANNNNLGDGSGHSGNGASSNVTLFIESWRHGNFIGILFTTMKLTIRTHWSIIILSGPPNDIYNSPQPQNGLELGYNKIILARVHLLQHFSSRDSKQVTPPPSALPDYMSPRQPGSEQHPHYPVPHTSSPNKRMSSPDLGITMQVRGDQRARSNRPDLFLPTPEHYHRNTIASSLCLIPIPAPIRPRVRDGMRILIPRLDPIPNLISGPGRQGLTPNWPPTHTGMTECEPGTSSSRCQCTDSSTLTWASTERRAGPIARGLSGLQQCSRHGDRMTTF